MDTRDKSHIWGGQYNRKISDLLVMQEEISSDISENLRLKLTGEEQKRVTKHYTDNVEAYQLYLKGRHFADQFKKAEALKILDRLQEQSKHRFVEPFAMAWVYVGLGDKEQALQLLEKAYENREDAMLWLNTDPKLEDLRSEPKFRELVGRVGLPQ